MKKLKVTPKQMNNESIELRSAQGKDQPFEKWNKRHELAVNELQYPMKFRNLKLGNVIQEESINCLIFGDMKHAL